MAEDDKPRPVQITKPEYIKDRTNHLRIHKDAAQRLIARYLRENDTCRCERYGEPNLRRHRVQHANRR
jgi:hypothetical protein